MDKNKKNVIVIFGGKSVESDVSIITGVQISNALKNEEYNILPIYISQNGLWYYSNSFFNITFFTKKDFLKDKSVFRVNLGVDKNLYFVKKNKQILKYEIYFAFLGTHGHFGENGSLQGYLNMCDIPYSSPDVYASANAMDKLFTKQILSENGVKIAPYVSISQNEFKDKSYLEKINNIKFPVVVKPNSLGSSIGISFCKNKNQLKNAISFAFLFDTQILIEKAVENLKEVNFALNGNEFEIEFSSIEEVSPKNDILTFENKYLDNSSSKGMESTSRIVPAELSEDIKNKVIEFGKIAYKSLKCRGIVRIDFLIDSKTNDVFLNELNTIPGSMANYLFLDLTFSKLLKRAMEFSLKEREIKNKKVIHFSSSILNKFDSSSKLSINK